MPRERVFITVKTYPAISKKYDELVCTAGIRENGDWVRIYPVPFRKLGFEDRYKKYQWIEIDIKKNKSDIRPESFSPNNIEDIGIGEFVDTKDEWKERKQIIFKKQKPYTNLEEVIGKAKENQLSITVFKPAELKDFIIEEVDSEWSEEKIRILEEKAKQGSLFETAGDIVKGFRRVQKLPYKFSYQFYDTAGRESTLMIEDWEIGALYWNCLHRSGENKESAVKKVKAKYMEELAKRDLYLFLGTTKQYHGWAKNPFVIVGVFYPPKKEQLSLDY